MSQTSGIRARNRLRTQKAPGVRLLALLLCLALIGAACGDDAPEVGEPDDEADRDEVVLSLVSSFPRDDLLHAGFWRYVDNLEAAAPWIRFDYRGGPDAIDPFEQGEAVADGAVDMATLPESYYPHMLPFVHGLKLTPFTPMEERENGVWELVNRVHEEDMGVHYLGRVTPNMPFQLYTNVELTEPDFSGMTFRVSPIYVPLVEALGGSVVSMPAGEIYTAIERGVVDGFGWPSIGITSWGFEEVTRFEILPEFYENIQIIMINLDVWNSLDQETRDVMTQVMIDTEPEISDLHAQMLVEERAERAETGMQPLEFEGAERELFLRTANEAGWEHALREDPRTQELRDLFEQ